MLKSRLATVVHGASPSWGALMDPRLLMISALCYYFFGGDCARNASG